MNANVAGTADNGLYCVGPNCAAAMPMAPTVVGSSLSPVNRWFW